MLAMIPSVMRGVDGQDLDKINSIARAAYPTVRQLRTETLSEWMQGKREGPLLIVDVRSRQEFVVSQLHGAVNLQTPEQIVRTVTERKPLRTILYCSVGFRSSRLAHLVTQRGIGEVFNLEGSIFQWANEGRAVYQGDKVVQEVHPYGKRWAGLLREGLASAC
jgi:rhodanese-related sulfurtransferase